VEGQVEEEMQHTRRKNHQIHRQEAGKNREEVNERE